MEQLLNASKALVFMAMFVSLLDCLIGNDDMAEGVRMVWILSVLAAVSGAIRGIFLKG